METQWRVGPNGPTGLDYGALPFVLRMIGISRSSWAEVFGAVRLMESAALAKMYEQERKNG